jgi:hypothetical protein
MAMRAWRKPPAHRCGAVEQVLAGQVAVPCDLGGKAGCAEVTEAICRALR